MGVPARADRLVSANAAKNIADTVFMIFLSELNCISLNARTGFAADIIALVKLDGIVSPSGGAGERVAVPPNFP